MFYIVEEGKRDKNGNPRKFVTVFDATGQQIGDRTKDQLYSPFNTALAIVTKFGMENQGTLRQLGENIKIR